MVSASVVGVRGAIRKRFIRDTERLNRIRGYSFFLNFLN